MTVVTKQLKTQKTNQNKETVKIDIFGFDLTNKIATRNQYIKTLKITKSSEKFRACSLKYSQLKKIIIISIAPSKKVNKVEKYNHIERKDQGFIAR